jgi:cytochrome c oxidase subunit 3
VTPDLTLKEPFHEARQQREAGFLGMYIFLGSEIMLFGGVFAALWAYRLVHPQAAVEAAGHLKMWLGAANTAVLLTSSLFVALGVTCARAGARRMAALWLAAAAALGLVFLVIKGVEYRLEYLDGLMPGIGPQSPLRARPAALFIDLYFAATALHALHLTIGVGLIGTVAARLALRSARSAPKPVVVEFSGLYWHLVDVIWIFLFPILYLARG